jgi:hypothetical protein
MAALRNKSIIAIVMMVAYSSRRSTAPTNIGRSSHRWITSPSTKTTAIEMGRASHQRLDPRKVARSAYCT